MHELCNTADGARGTPHADTAELKVMFQIPGKPGGPKCVAAPNGLQLYVPPDMKAEDFRRLVHDPGRYRFVQVDRYRKTIDGAEVFFLDIMDTSLAPAKETDDEDRSLARELVRQQGNLTTALIQSFSGLVDSVSRLVGATEPAREALLPIAKAAVNGAANAPIVVETEATPPEPASPMSVLNSVVGSAGPLLGVLLQHYVLTKVCGLSSEQIRAMGIGGIPGMPMGAPSATSAPNTAAANDDPRVHVTPPTAEAAAAGPTSTGSTPPQTDAVAAQLHAVEKLLAPHELGMLLSILQTMSPCEIDAWRTRLCSMSAADAAATIRAELAAIQRRQAQVGGAQ